MKKQGCILLILLLYFLAIAPVFADMLDSFVDPTIAARPDKWVTNPFNPFNPLTNGNPSDISKYQPKSVKPVPICYDCHTVKQFKSSVFQQAWEKYKVRNK
jgi:hypothetical protein